MTAPEPTRPADEHTDAVALDLDPDIFDPTVKRSSHPAAVIQIAARKHMATIAARNVLTSTDPAVHAAMLAALVRAGVLTERFAIRDEGGSVWLDAHGDHREAKPGGLEFADRGDAEGIVARPHEEVMRRLVTPWEVSPAHRQMPNSLAPTECPCASCLTEAGVSAWWMIVCDECGNKRCPHGTDHRHDCTGSNEAGQAGSRHVTPWEVAP